MTGQQETPPIASPLCHAPWATLEFDPSGDVMACCASGLYPLGNVRDRSIEEIWTGPRARALRSALRRGDLTLGCDICRHRDETTAAELPYEYYRGLPMPDPEPGWPSRLSFSLHNTCNLECGMCGADRSSRIRIRRDGLPPLPHVYGDAFFEELAPFLERAAHVDFVGGEPFLIREHERVWDLLEERGLDPTCGVTTNGTVWNARVERVLDRFRTDVRVSIDGITASTFESIRVGADRDAVFANLERFRARALERGTDLSINWCLLQQNHHELGRMLLFAEERDLDVHTMTVMDPGFGVQHLPTGQLRAALDALRTEGRSIEPLLRRNRGAWHRQLEAIEAELRLRAGPVRERPSMAPPSPHHVDRIVEAIQGILGPVRAELGPPRDEVHRHLRRFEMDHPAVPPGGHAFASIDLGGDGAIRAFDLGSVCPAAGVDARTGLRGVLEAIFESLGGQVWFAEERQGAGRVDHVLFLGRAVRDKQGVVLRMVTTATTTGAEVTIGRDDWFVPRPSVPVPVALDVARRRRRGDDRGVA